VQDLQSEKEAEREKMNRQLDDLMQQAKIYKTNETKNMREMERKEDELSAANEKIAKLNEQVNMQSRAATDYKNKVL